MAIVNAADVKSDVLKRYTEARESITLLKKAKTIFESAAVSDRIPGYTANKMDFGAYINDKFAALFIDMRNSTSRAIQIGPEQTFLTMHAVIPAMIHVIERYNGTIIDLPGDGAMALFKENTELTWDTGGLLNKESLAVRAGQVLIDMIKAVANPILESDKIPPVVFGAGIDAGPVIITKTGTDSTFDTKAIGNCINSAAKMSKGKNQVWISEGVYKNIPNIQWSFNKDVYDSTIYKNAR